MPEHLIAIHQPNFFPWAGYFDKIRRADTFVFLDDVQYPKTGGVWTNRVKILVNGKAKWLTAPIDRSYSGTRNINDMRFAASNWRDDILRKLDAAYSRTPHYTEAMALLSPLIRNPEQNIAEYNIHAITTLCTALGISPNFLRSSALRVEGTATERLIALTRAAGGNTYLAGGGAEGYQDDDLFAQSGITLEYQNFTPTPYAQATPEFVAGLSAIDRLMWEGIHTSRETPALQPQPHEMRGVRGNETPPANNLAITASHLFKSFPLKASSLLRLWLGKTGRVPSFEALKDVSLCVNQGEMLGVLGSNGAGKSTLLRTLAGIYSPDSGTITMHGSLAGLFELGGMGNVQMTGRQYALRYLQMHGVPPQARADIIADIADFSELKAYFDAPIRTYSAGMGARLYFATATALRHDIYLIDEILSVGDEHFQVKSWARIRERLASGVSGILVTHDWSAVIKLCRRAAILDHGRITYEDNADATVARYLQLPTPATTRAEIIPDACYTLQSGAPLDVSFIIDVKEDVHCEFALSIEHMMLGVGWEIVLISDFHPIGTSKGRYRVRVSAPHTPLKPGRYSLNPFLRAIEPDGSIGSLHSLSWTYGNGLTLEVTGDAREDIAPFPITWSVCMSPLCITTHALTKTYDIAGVEKHAVDHVSLVIHEGERVGIIGRNGAGKTTLLQLIAGIAGATNGEMKIAGHVTAIFTLGIGLRDDLTGRENILIDGELHGHTRAASASFVHDVIAFADLGEFIDRPVRTYSTGMKARLAFSMLVHIDPEILIIDEALSVGDAKFAAKATAKMRELAARGRILIVVSHSMGSIVDMCSRCIWMEDGRVRMDGTPAEVTRAYLDEVRHTDDTLLLERFKHVLVHASETGWDIPVMEFCSEPHGTALAVLHTAEQTCLRASIQGTMHAACEASFTITRLDNVAICSSHSPTLTINAQGTLTLLLDLGALPINYGVYSALLVLRSDGRIVAQRSLCFEVVNHSPPRGGRPLLVTSLSIHSERIS